MLAYSITTINRNHWLLDPTDPQVFLCAHDGLRLGLLIWQDLPVYLTPRHSRGEWYRRLIASPKHLQIYFMHDLYREFWRRSLVFQGFAQEIRVGTDLATGLTRGLPEAKEIFYGILHETWCGSHKYSSFQELSAGSISAPGNNREVEAWPFPLVVVGDQVFAGVDRLLLAEEYYVALEDVNYPLSFNSRLKDES